MTVHLSVLLVPLGAVLVCLRSRGNHLWFFVITCTIMSTRCFLICSGSRCRAGNRAVFMSCRNRALCFGRKLYDRFNQAIKLLMRWNNMLSRAVLQHSCSDIHILYSRGRLSALSLTEGFRHCCSSIFYSLLCYILLIKSALITVGLIGAVVLLLSHAVKKVSKKTEFLIKCCRSVFSFSNGPLEVP